MATHFDILGGKVHVYKRERSNVWQAATFLEGRNFRVSTRHEGLSEAKDFAEDWYLGLRGKLKSGELAAGVKFKVAAKAFMDEFEVITHGQRSPEYIKGHWGRINRYLIPFFGEKAVTQINPGMVQDYRVHRIKNGFRDKAPSRSTLHQETVCLRQILKTAQRHGWLSAIPDISPPYKSSPKITHRAWFSPAEYKQLYEATRDRAKNPKKERWRTASENMHDFVLLMVNTGLRPDEALRLEYRDVAIVTDGATRERILEIEVRGKRGVGYCKSMPGAVLPFQRLLKRNNGQPTDRLFPYSQREMFNNVLNELNLKHDRDGQVRTTYSLRHTYICFRLMEGADIYQIAKNCRTSVEMIETYYASHIKNTLDASAINVRKSRKPIS